MANEIIESEFNEVETMPSQELAVKSEETGLTANYLDRINYVAENVDKYVQAKQKIWNAILKIAKDGDWAIFGSGDQEKVCLSGPGAERIASMLGVSFTNFTSKKEVWTDDKGAAYRWWFEVDAEIGGRSIHALGRASSRDKFFGKAKGEWKELSDIAEDNIKMAAYRGAMKEGVRILFGLRNIPKAEFATAGIKLLGTGGGHDFAPKVPFKPIVDTTKPIVESANTQKQREIEEMWGDGAKVVNEGKPKVAKTGSCVECGASIDPNYKKCWSCSQKGKQ